MPQIDLTLGAVLLASSLGTALLALLVMSRLRPARRIDWTPVDRLDERVVYLFRDRELVDATRDARSLLENGPKFLESWPRLLSVLEERFPGVSEEVAELTERQRVVLEGEGGGSLEAEWRGGLTRIAVREPDAPGATTSADRYGQAALTAELATLRTVVDGAPMLVWKEDAAGAVRWANGAYVTLAERLLPAGESVGWPLPRIFGQRPIGPDMVPPPRRLSVRLDDDEEAWFESYDEARGEDTLVFALPADKLVRAEASLREFVQTLTKTFAHLPTGLAVFDRDRRLALFNPALTDLSALEPQFLSGRPTLFEFLDRLRQKQRAPEPKDFKTWRQQIVDLESAAASGTYQETWSLPTGQTYRVTGRPHPDRGIAFLFEDISAEMTATRHFRAELELGQAVIDNLAEAIAVFSASGSLILSNAAYARLWGHDPAQVLGDTDIVEATRIWQDACAPSPTWGDLRDFACAPTERVEWRAEVRGNDGLVLECRFVPLVGHATLVAFTELNGSGDAGVPSGLRAGETVSLR